MARYVPSRRSSATMERRKSSPGGGASPGARGVCGVVFTVGRSGSMSGGGTHVARSLDGGERIAGNPRIYNVALARFHATPRTTRVPFVGGRARLSYRLRSFSGVAVTLIEG